MTAPRPEEPAPSGAAAQHGFTNAVVRRFLHSNLSLILIVLSLALGVVALLVTPREEDPQIVVPLADVLVSFPGRSAEETEKLVATPLEKILYQIDGVEYVYSMSRPGQAIITVRFFVGQDRERSLVKLFKKVNENVDIVPPGVDGWVVKPVEIDDVPIVALTFTSARADDYVLRRVGEEAAERLAALPDVSRCYVVGGRPRAVHVYLDAAALQAHNLAPLDVQRAIRAAGVTVTAGSFTRDDRAVTVDVGSAFRTPRELGELVVAASDSRPVYLKTVARVIDGAAEATSYVRHGWGPAAPDQKAASAVGDSAQPAVTVAIAKKKGANAVTVARRVSTAVEALRRDVLPGDVECVVTRDYGVTADAKVNELVESLAVAVVIVVALLTLGLGWRAALVVAIAVPVVFGLTLAVNLLLGFTINRVTLFALILSLGLLVDDPIVDVENIARHFALRRRATRSIVLEAVAEIRPPLINATLAVIFSFLPMFFITGMMGPYMRPMALNVPVTMLMSMVVAFTITPWLSYYLLGRARRADHAGHSDSAGGALERTLRPILVALLASRGRALAFLGLVALLTVAAVALAALRQVPLKMLPYDNKNELLLVLDFDEGTTLERADAGVRRLEARLARVPEVVDFVAYVGVAAPMDFNGLVRHYYLRSAPHQAQIQVNLVDRKSRAQQSHAVGLRVRDELTQIAAECGARLKLVETPPGPPVISAIVAEVYGSPDQTYAQLADAATTVARRLTVEPGVREVDDVLEAPSRKFLFETDKEKAALSGIAVADVAETVQIGLAGATVETLRIPSERQPLHIVLRLPRAERSHVADLAQLRVRGASGQLVPLAELGAWREARVDQTIYHKNLERVVYVFAETIGRTPPEVVLDVQSDRVARGPADAVQGWVSSREPAPVRGRSFLRRGGGVAWALPQGMRVDFAGEGEWNITIDVFRDLGLAFAAAMVGIYILLVTQTGSFVVPLVIMLAIPLTILGVMPGFWILNMASGGSVAGYADPVNFTATAMIGMIALSGIVTRNSIILIDFIHLALREGRGLIDALVASVVVRLRPILLTAGAAMLSSIPITADPIFSGLAWALIFGLLASTLFTVLVVPVAYWLIYARTPGHGAQ